MSSTVNDELRKWINQLYDDESLRSNMDDDTSNYWLHAAAESLREASRLGKDVEKAYRVARAGVLAVNAEIGKQSEP
jgi:hypothetical protein